ncbi:serine-rich adhesin for platelets isoform X2 [Venturia canescens]|uniref:serine-rich adhesin for platelets isoform X2 n=1 Tax=Venturia canescens TaxID=32260 RepID=UPI001C9D607C|nr:serine-rich adhesin for platelets isoform X2 [Venturia canescens]
MSESDGERAARSVALEQAYVHDVYEECAEKTAARTKHWPRIYQFLEELEPGALVCDVGCGNGKYLSVNENVFKIGADRCKRLTDIAREKENEVMICDNLALPFRDESFDAVLSIAVVHHFATTERRVNALKELARVLRIGGRLVISVWAMEQRHRKFESQDVLVPWPKAYCLSGGSRRTKRRGRTNGPDGGASVDSFEDVADDLDLDRNTRKCRPVTSGKRGAANPSRSKNRNYWIDPIFSPSPSTSSLSSPNETCYSFFRRALQKLAGGKRDSAAGNRGAWFLETWHNNGGSWKNKREQHRGQNFQNEDIGDVDDIPIELRRLEEDNVTLSKHPTTPPCETGENAGETLGLKSKSLGDILEIQRLDLVRSRSSIPGFSSTVTSQFYLDEESETPSPQPPLPETSREARGIFSTETINDSTNDNSTAPLLLSSSSVSSTNSLNRSTSSTGKPRLVKQKSHLLDDSPLQFIQEPANGVVVRRCSKDLVEFREAAKTDSAPRANRRRRGNVHKQSSMNEELMSMERLVERDRVRKNIMKQASLNEEIICKPRGQTFCHFRESLYSGNATMQRIQLIKSDLTNRIKQSTTSMENKVSSITIKNGFAKILQGWKQQSSERLETNESEGKNVNEDEVEDGSRSQESQNVASINGEEGKNATSGKTNANGSQAGVGNKNAAGEGAVPGGESIERRLSKEDGSDSSKDSSLQSDTSVDSEDSFASVIYVPKNHQQQIEGQQQGKHNPHPYNIYRRDSFTTRDNQFGSPIDVSTIVIPPLSGGHHQLRTTSAPPSPRIKNPPGDLNHGSGPRSKLISLSPLLKQFPATSKSLPPPSPPGLSPRNFDPSFASSNPRDSFASADFFGFLPPRQSSTTNDDVPNNDKPGDVATKSTKIDNDLATKTTPTTTSPTIPTSSVMIPIATEVLTTITTNTTTSTTTESTNNDSTSTVIPPEKPKIEDEDTKDRENSTSNESINDPDTRRSRLDQIKELLKQKPGFATRSIKSPFPLVRRASTITGRSESASLEARTLPRLLSLELFNPETDDLDSDSSGLSSPESIGSVISVISDQRFSLKNNKNATGNEKQAQTTGESSESDASKVEIKNQVEEADCTLTKVGEKIVEEKTDRQDVKKDEPGVKISLPESVKSITETIDLPSHVSGLRSNCKYTQLVDDTIAWLSGASPDPTLPESHYPQKYIQEPSEPVHLESDEAAITDQSALLLPKSVSEEAIDDFVMVTKSGEFVSVLEKERVETTAMKSVGEPVNNSSLNGDSVIDRSTSLSSDVSQIEEGTKILSDPGSTLSLGSSTNFEYKSLRERRKYLYQQQRSASEEIPRSPGVNRVIKAGDSSRRSRLVTDGNPYGSGVSSLCSGVPRRPSTCETPLSGSSSQESLPSDRGSRNRGDDDEDNDEDDEGGGGGAGGGGAITYHQYYHVFKEGELDQLINKYVENLHIISSYYDHASWCIVAEKVQVWTI